MGKMMKTVMRVATALLLGTHMVSAQTREVVKELNSQGFWMPYTKWLGSDQDMEQYLYSIGDYSPVTLQRTLEALADDEKRAGKMMAAYRDIVGKKMNKMARKRLENLFDDVEAALRAFDDASQAQRRAKTLRSRIEAELKTRPEATMPAGRLNYFSYGTHNGFAASGFSVELQRNSDGHGGRLERQIEQRFVSEEEPMKTETAAVGDEVLERVRQIIEQGGLYKVGRSYMPDYDVTDASNWSLSMHFEGTDINSSGYAVGPDYGDALSQVLKYLDEVLKGVRS